jgi:hypothetical protein
VVPSIGPDDWPARVVVPHSLQNFAVGFSSVPHDPQTTAKRVPHSSQNFALSLLSLLHFGHFIPQIPDHPFGSNQLSPE